MFKIFNSFKKDKQVYLTLVENETGIVLQCVDSDGTVITRGNILEITHRGDIVRFGNVSEETGLNIPGTDGYVHVKNWEAEYRGTTSCVKS